MWKLIDRFFDDIAKKLAENLCSNIELMEQQGEADPMVKANKPSAHQPSSRSSTSVQPEPMSVAQASVMPVCTQATFIA